MDSDLIQTRVQLILWCLHSCRDANVPFCGAVEKIWVMIQALARLGLDIACKNCDRRRGHVSMRIELEIRHNRMASVPPPPFHSGC